MPRLFQVRPLPVPHCAHRTLTPARRICKDAAKKFCPSCGNPTLLRVAATIAAPGASPHAPALQVHLKRNFQHRTRGTIFALPAPQPGSAKTGARTGPVLRADQAEYVRAQRHAEGRRAREEQRMLRGVLGGERAAGSWTDPDWVPEMLSAGAGGKGRSTRGAGMDGDMPVIGYGRKNPNERRRRK